MVEKRINLIMVIMSTLGGILGFILGEIFLNFYKYKLPSVLITGVYFGILAFCIGTMCIIAEFISPRLNGEVWKNNYFKSSLKFLVPSTFLFLFIVGMAAQFIYEIGIGRTRNVSDVVFAIDTSGSMSKTDPKNERFKALLELLDSMNSNYRFAIYKFDDKAEKIIGMSYVTDDMKSTVRDEIKKYEKADGNTNMRDVLEKSYDEISSNKKFGRNAMIVLLSDGGDNYDLNKKFNSTIKPFREKNIPIYTIGMSNGNNFDMLKRIASSSNGNYYNAEYVKNLKGTFDKIYLDIQKSLLIDKRSGIYETSVFYMILRIAFITIISTLIAASICFVFDNKNMLRAYILGGGIAGIIAGTVLEFGFLKLPWDGTYLRALVDVIIAIIFTLFPVSVNIKDYSKRSFKGITLKNNFDVQKSYSSFR